MRYACVHRGAAAALSALLIATFTLLAWPGRAGAVVGGTPAPDSDSRFDAVALLITDAPWLACGGWISGSTTLIGPGQVLVARHSVEDSAHQLPAQGSRRIKARFRRGVDGSVNGHFAGWSIDCEGGYQEIYVDHFIAAPNSGLDMVIGVLEHAPVGIDPIPLAVNHNPVSGEQVVIAGWGFDGTCLGVGEAWTLRIKTGTLPTLRYNAWCCFDYNTVSWAAGNCFTNINANSVVGNLHDSGAPLLVPDPSDPQRLQMFGMVTSITTAEKVSAWNDAGGQPPLSNSVTPPPPPHACPADVNGDGIVDTTDVTTFLQWYLSGDPRADIDGEPGIALDDLLSFVSHFLQGC